MNIDLIWTMLVNLLPGILVAVVAYLLIDKFLTGEKMRRDYEIRKISSS